MEAVYLFAGGGVSEGWGSPFTPVLAVEQYRPAALAYRLNHGLMPWIADATDLDVIREAKRKFGGVPALFAAPPCPWASKAKDKKKNYSQQIGAYAIVADWAEALRPRAVVVENVTAAGRNPPGRLLRIRLRRLGYAVAYQALDAVRFGAPQFRERGYLVAIRKTLGEFRFPHGSYGTRCRPYVTTSSAIGAISEAQALALGCLPMSRKWQWLMRGIPPGKNWTWLRQTEHECKENARRLEYVHDCFGGDPNTKSARRLDPAAPSHTLLTSPAPARTMHAVCSGLYGGGYWRRLANGRPVLPACGRETSGTWDWDRKTGEVFVLAPDGSMVPITTRLVSVVEYMALMGLEWTGAGAYRFPGGDRSLKSVKDMYRILGNGICPQLWKPLCERLAEALEGGRRRSGKNSLPAIQVVTGDALEVLRRIP